MKSNVESMTPKKTMNLAIDLVLHFFGVLRPSSSRLSVDMASNGASENRFTNSICTGSIGMNGRNREQTAIVNMFEKFALMVFLLYLVMLPNAFLPSTTPSAITPRLLSSNIIDEASLAT